MTVQLNSKELIAGVPVLKVRHTLLRSGGSFRADWITDNGLPAKLCVELLNLKYIEKSSSLRHNDKSGFDWFGLTDSGRQFVRASAAPRIKRSSAVKTVKALRERIAEIGNSNAYMMRVTEAVIFGSYAKDSNDAVGDVDLAFRLQRKEEIFGKDHDWDQAVDKDFNACGRTERTILDVPFWPEMKVRLHLKNRQRTISLHHMDEFLAIQRKAKTPFLVLAGDEKQILSDIEHRKLSYAI